MGGFISSLIVTIVGVAFPTYASFKALESTDATDKYQWLSYWIIYGFFSLFEKVTDTFVSWIPFYFEVKLIILVLLQLPGPKLASVAYTTYVRPYLKQHETQIDASVASAEAKLQNKTYQLASEVAKNNLEKIEEFAAETMNQKKKE